MSRSVLRLACLATLLTPAHAEAHEVRPALLELHETAGQIWEVQWRVPARGDLRLGIYVRLPGDCEEVAPRRASLVEAMHVERWRTRCAGDLAGRELSIEGLTNTLSDVIVRIARADGSTQTLRVVPASPVFVVPTAPGGFEVARTYLVLGVGHILLGVDHLLFVLALLILAGARPMPLPRSDWAWCLPVYGIGVVASYWTLARVVRFWG